MDLKVGDRIKLKKLINKKIYNNFKKDFENCSISGVWDYNTYKQQYKLYKNSLFVVEATSPENNLITKDGLILNYFQIEKVNYLKNKIRKLKKLLAR